MVKKGSFSKMAGGKTQRQANGHTQKVMESGGKNHLPRVAKKGQRGVMGNVKVAPGMGKRGHGSGKMPGDASD